MTEEKRNDEIDLIELFLNIYIFFKKHFWFFTIAVVIGAILGYSTKFFSKEHYESSSLINSYTVSDNILIQQIDNIQSIISDNNKRYLSERMEIDTVSLASINSLEAEIVYDEKDDKKSLGFVKVTANVTNNEILKFLNQGISNYLEKEPFVQNEISLFVENNQNLIDEIDKQITKIEALQDKLIHTAQSKGDVNIYNDQNSFQNELLGLIKEKQSREKFLRFATPYRIIQDFTIYQKPIRKTKTYTFISAFAFFMLALFYLIIRNINKTIKEKRA
ncbi:MAG: hypothetical protein KQH79_05475 [Bacteroidetes bacterium]|nr:hypothetical protein [Bacteroidota bacterium]